MRVRSLGWEDPLEVGHGNTLQCSCLKNRMDGRAWPATKSLVGWQRDKAEATEHALHFSANCCPLLSASQEAVIQILE